MSLAVWSMFVLTEAVLSLTPGPAVLLVVAHALRRGAPASVWAALGILSANLVYFALSATGLGVLLVASYEAFSLVRWVGAAYLIWLGVRMLVRCSTTRAAAPPAAVAARATFVNGFVVQAANPKALLFFVALLPQFIDPSGHVAAQVMILAVTSVVIELIVLLAYGVTASRFHGLATHPRFARLADASAGTMLVTAGIGIGAMRA